MKQAPWKGCVMDDYNYYVAEMETALALQGASAPGSPVWREALQRFLAAATALGEGLAGEVN